MIGKVAFVVAVILPSSQLSLAVGAVRSATVATGHPPVSVGKFDVSGDGASVSPMITGCVCVAILPAVSLYVHVIVVLAVICGVRRDGSIAVIGGSGGSQGGDLRAILQYR